MQYPAQGSSVSSVRWVWRCWGGLTTFQRSLTMQLGGRMSTCSLVPFMLPLSPGTRHCICQLDSTRAAPSLKEPFIWKGEAEGRRSTTGPDSFLPLLCSRPTLPLPHLSLLLTPLELHSGSCPIPPQTQWEAGAAQSNTSIVLVSAVSCPV